MCKHQNPKSSSSFSPSSPSFQRLVLEKKSSRKDGHKDGVTEKQPPKRPDASCSNKIGELRTPESTRYMIHWANSRSPQNVV